MTDYPFDDDAAAYRTRTSENVGEPFHTVGYLSYVIAHETIETVYKESGASLDYAFTWLDKRGAWNGRVTK